MYNVLLACDSEYYSTWAINCIRSIQQYAPWLKIHVVIVNPKITYQKIENVIYYEDRINLPNETCKVPYYQAVRFIKCADLFPNNELVFSIDCDTVCTRSFDQADLDAICQTVHVQRHQKNVRWMAGFVTYGSSSEFRNELKQKLLDLPIDHWVYGYDQDVLNSLSNKYQYKKLNVGNWMSFGRGSGIFLTLKGDQKTSNGYLEIYHNILKTIQ